MKLSAIKPKIEYDSKTIDDHVCFFSNANGQRRPLEKFATLYVNLADNRAAHVLRKRGITQPRVTDTWRRFAELLSPTTVLDIGANYGEIALSAHYPLATKVFLFEPNPALHACLSRSIDSRIDAERFTLVPKAVGKEAGTAFINFDLKWSGTSSIARKPSDRSYKGPGELKIKKAEVEVISIDEFLSDSQVGGANLLFKIDVEGYELSVLRGMMRMLSSCGFLGIVELVKRGRGNNEEDAETIRKLGELGTFFSTQDGAKIDIITYNQSTGVHNDLIFTNLFDSALP